MTAFVQDLLRRILPKQKKGTEIKRDEFGAPIFDNSGLPWLMRYRWFFVILFLLPLSLLNDVLLWAKQAFCRKYTPQMHHARVTRVQKQIREQRSAGNKKLCTDRPAWMAMSIRLGTYKNAMKRIQMADMNNILKVDTSRGTIIAEPFVTIGDITACLIPLGYTLPVVPELDDLSVGGLLMGCGIESSSHKYGLFDEVCTSYDVVLGNGELVHATADNEYADLFYALPWSYGTLGLLVAAELKIIPCKKYVKLTYIPCNSLNETTKVFSQSSTEEKAAMFVEGLVFSHTKAVVMKGEFADDADRLMDDGQVNELGRWYKPWFYEHVKSFLRKPRNAPAKEFIEYIPLRDYYHRHTRSIFWQMEAIVPFGNHPLYRLLMGWIPAPKVSLLKVTTPQSLHKTYETKFVFIDYLLPLDRMQETLDLFNDEFAFYPLWLCPHRVNRESQYHGIFRRTNDSQDAEMFVDIGIYGMPTTKNFNTNLTMPRIEEYMRKINGLQMLYTDTMQSREEFRQMFDLELYDRMRAKYGALEVFPDIYDKVRKM